VRGSDGKLENVFVRVRCQCFSFHTNATTTNHSIQVNREKVLSDGKDVVGKLLVELQVRKSTADGPGAREFYVNLTKPIPGWEGEIRDLVLKKKLVCLSHFFGGICDADLSCSLGKSSFSPTLSSLTVKFS
jgi:hypothetical protein